MMFLTRGIGLIRLRLYLCMHAACMHVAMVTYKREREREREREFFVSFLILIRFQGNLHACKDTNVPQESPQ